MDASTEYMADLRVHVVGAGNVGLWVSASRYTLYCASPVLREMLVPELQETMGCTAEGKPVLLLHNRAISAYGLRDALFLAHDPNAPKTWSWER